MTETPKMIQVTQERSAIGGSRKQRESLRGLGLLRRGASVIVQDTRAVRGLIQKVAHLVRVQE